jgi:predicted lactoylglutathione lyase
MKKTTLLILGIAASFCFGFAFKATITKQRDNNLAFKQGYNNLTIKRENMKLGAFSVSLSVKDLETSKKFYEALGFTVFGGDQKMNYLIMKNGSTLIGLFQGMFEGNILTFNPGWDENAATLQQFEDVRAIQRKLKASGIKLETEADEKTKGPASITIKDPDGNVILLDQHI